MDRVVSRITPKLLTDSENSTVEASTLGQEGNGLDTEFLDEIKSRASVLLRFKLSLLGITQELTLQIHRLTFLLIVETSFEELWS